MLAKTLAVAAAALMVQAARAQCTSCPSGQSGDIKVVRVPLFGGLEEVLACQPAATDFTISLAGRSWNNDHWVLRIYDCASTSLPTHDIGRVTIIGNPSDLASLAVLVASPTQVWEESPIEPLNPGAVDFGGLAVSEPNVLAKTRASVAIAGDITRVGTSTVDPDVRVNQIVRIQVEGLTTGTITTGGSIDGDIIAAGGELFNPSGTDAVGQVRAWNAIRGKVQAESKNIAAVRIVGAAAGSFVPEGISGDILAAQGSIGTIYTTGPIGNGSTNPQERLKITAGDGINEIRAVSESPGSLILDRDFDAEIVAHKLIEVNPSGFNYLGPDEDGTSCSWKQAATCTARSVPPTSAA